MLMVPIYAISSLIALFSLEAAFVIDAIRDIYEVSLCSVSPSSFAEFGYFTIYTRFHRSVHQISPAEGSDPLVHI